MSIDVPNPLWVYRITHFKNIEHIFKNGLCIKTHTNFNPDHINIGNVEIIDIRKDFPVKIDSYGNIGDYVPFYFGRESIMLYNILTNYNVDKQMPEDIVYLCCKVDILIENSNQYFFTDGQANKEITEHFLEKQKLSNLDWAIINGSDFKNSEDDPDKKRRYQAEFLVFQYVPVNCIGAIVVYNQTKKRYVDALAQKSGLNIPVLVKKTNYYFHF